MLHTISHSLEGHLILNAVFRRDPTRTLSLRTRFVREVDKRFNELVRVIRKSIIDNDCFGFNMTVEGLPITVMAALTPAQRNQFGFKRSGAKVDAFMGWLNEQEERGILEIVHRPGGLRGIHEAWTDIWVKRAYEKGVIRGRTELHKQDNSIPTLDDQYAIDQVMRQPFHVDRLGALYTRTFNELKGIDQVMDQQISRVLTDGLMAGKGPREIARILDDRVKKIGRTRARTLARTEIIRAHHVANINEYRQWQIEGVTIKAEWATAGYNVCPECEALESRVFPLDEIEGMIPLHPNCRCVAIPVKVSKPSAGKPSAPKVVWERQTDALKAKNALKEVVGTADKTGISFGDKYPKKDRSLIIERVNTIGKDMARIQSRYPKLAEFSKNHPLEHLRIENTKSIEGRRGKAAFYERGQIHIAAKPAPLKAELTLGGDNVGLDLASLYRHEYGHHIYRNAEGVMTEWRRISHLGGRGSVSLYAETNAEELFAESFAAFTSPKYGGANKLPDALHSFLSKLLRELK